jgi:transposase
VRDDFIAVALGLPELKVPRQRELGDRFEVTVRYRREEVNCPRCGKVTNKEHDRRQQRKKDRRLKDKAVILILAKRRFRCYGCGKVFTGPDEVFGTRKRTTRRFREYLGQEALYQTVRRVAQREGVGEGLGRRCVAEQIGRTLGAKGMGKTPGLTGLDEFSVRKRQLYRTAICDLENREVMEVVEGQGKQKVEEYLSKLAEPEKVKAVAMDMHKPFRQAVEECLPRAKVVADKFHVVRHINEAVDKVRSRHQGGNAKGKRKELFRSRYTLLKGAEKVADWEKEKLDRVFFRYPEVHKAWEVKGKFRAWYKETDKMKAEKRLAALGEKMIQSGLPEFTSLFPMFSNWHDEILNYFDYRITNSIGCQQPAISFQVSIQFVAEC